MKIKLLPEGKSFLPQRVENFLAVNDDLCVENWFRMESCEKIY